MLHPMRFASCLSLLLLVVVRLTFMWRTKRYPAMRRHVREQAPLRRSLGRLNNCCRKDAQVISFRKIIPSLN